MDQIHRDLLKKYHTLCTVLGLDDEAKRAILSSWGVESSRDLTQHQLIDICAKLSEQVDEKQGTACHSRLFLDLSGPVVICALLPNYEVCAALAFGRVLVARCHERFKAFNLDFYVSVKSYAHRQFISKVAGFVQKSRARRGLTSCANK